MSTVKEKQMRELETWRGVGEAAEELAVSRPHVHNLLQRRELRGVRTRIGWLVDPEHAGYVRLKREALVKRSRQARQDST